LGWGRDVVRETVEPFKGKTADHPLDAMCASKDNHAVMLENEAVRVLDTWIGSGQRTEVHSHEWPSTLYVVSWSDFVRYDADGNILVDSREMANPPTAGAVLWSPPLPPHYVENVGGGELRVIAVELKAS
jgi:hypothetical protein